MEEWALNAITHPARAALPNWPRLLRRQDAAAYLGIGVSMLDEHGPSPKRLGRRVLYDIRDLDRWADALDDQPLDEAPKKAEGDRSEEHTSELQSLMRITYDVFSFKQK